MPCVPGILVAAKWTLAFNRGWFLPQPTLQKMSEQDVRTHPPMVLLAITQGINLLPFFLSQIGYLPIFVRVLL